MKVIPVLDLLNGVAVHAVRGRRQEYQPLKSVLCDCAEPVEVAAALKKMGFVEGYVADLDAIMGKGTNSRVIGRIVDETGLNLMVDAGVDSLAKAKETFRSKASKLIVGTETLRDLHSVEEALEAFGSEKVVVSLDLRNGEVLSKEGTLQSISAVTAARKLQGLGVRQLIALDLARVGSGEGTDLQLIKTLILEVDMEVYVGGGVRDTQDLKTLQKLGVSGALIATALHTGKISAQQLHSAGFT
jgi:phosphoribosylformimino-5-aminoimidazole carboxamide ribotide isomerase